MNCPIWKLVALALVSARKLAGLALAALVLAVACDSSTPPSRGPVGGKADDPNGAAPPVLWSIGGNGGSGAAWSPDGSRIATAGDSIQVLDPVTGHILESFHDGKRTDAVAWSTDGSQLVTVGNLSGTVAVRSAENGVIIKQLAAPFPRAVAWSVDGKRIAAGGIILRIWDVESGAVIRTVNSVGSINQLAFLPVGDQVIVTDTQLEKVRVIRVADGATILNKPSACAEHGGRCGAYNPASDVVAVANLSSVSVYDRSTGQLVQTIPVSTDAIRSIDWIDDTHLLVLSESALFTVDAESITVTKWLPVTPGRYSDFQRNPADDSVLLHGKRDFEGAAIDVHSGQTIHYLNAHGDVARSANFDPTGELIASAAAGDDTSVQIRTDDAELVATLDEFPAGNPLALEWRPGAVRPWTIALQSASAATLVEIDESGTPKQVVLPQGGELEGLAWSRDGNRLATVGDNIMLWLPGGELIKVFGFADYHTVAWGDGDLFAASTSAGTIEIWDAASGQKLKQLGSGLVGNMAWSGDLIAVSTGQLQVWDATTGEKVHQTDELEADIAALRWHPDGTRLAVTLAGGDIAVWDVETKSFVTRFAAHRSVALDADWHPDGSRLVSCGNEGRITLWDFADE